MEFRIVSRLLVPLAATSLLLFVTAVGSAWYARTTQQRVSAMLNNHVASVRAMRELEGRVRDMDARLDRYLLTGEPAHFDAVVPIREHIAAALRAGEELAYTDEEQALMARVRVGCERLFAGYERAAARTGEARRAEIRALSGVAEEVLEPAGGFARLNEEMLAQTGVANEELSGPLTAGFLVIGLCGAAGGLLGGWVLAIGVTRSIQRTEGRLRRTAGRLSVIVPTARGSGDAAEWVDESVTAVLDRLRRIERDALRAEQLAWMGQMAAGIAHEIRNPLMAIKILVQTAADPHRGARFRVRDLGVMEREVARLERTVTGFLEFARPPLPEKQLVDPRALLEDAADGLRARADRQHVSLCVEVAAGAGPLMVDPNQFRQVVYNLLYNALDAQPGGGRIRLAAGTGTGRGPDEPELVLCVEDQGVGIPEAVGERIFDPFVSTKETGLGLGLSICRRIVEDHGGTIAAEARPGGGATFTVRVPLRPAV